MRIDQIKNFIKTVDSLSISKAADELYLSQSVLSKQINSMEQQLNTVLFDRTKAGIKLTPVGVVAYEHFIQVLDEYEKAIYSIKEYQNHVIGTLCFGKQIGLKVPKSITEAFTEFSNSYPKTSILRNSLNYGPMKKGLRDGEYDIYLTWGQEVDDNSLFEFLVVDIADACLVVADSHPLAGNQQATLDMFKEDNWITGIPEDSFRHDALMTQTFKKIGFEPHLIFTDELGAMIDLISDGVGVGLISKAHILYGAQSLTFLDLPEIPKRTMALAYRKDNKNPLTGEFISILKKQLGE